MRKNHGKPEPLQDSGLLTGQVPGLRASDCRGYVQRTSGYDQYLSSVKEQTSPLREQQSLILHKTSSYRGRRVSGLYGLESSYAICRIRQSEAATGRAGSEDVLEGLEESGDETVRRASRRP